MNSQESIVGQEVTPEERATLVQEILNAAMRDGVALDTSWLKHYIQYLSSDTMQYWLEKVRDDPTAVVHRMGEMKAMADSIDEEGAVPLDSEEMERLRQGFVQIMTPKEISDAKAMMRQFNMERFNR